MNGWVGGWGQALDGTKAQFSFEIGNGRGDKQSLDLALHRSLRMLPCFHNQRIAGRRVRDHGQFCHRRLLRPKKPKRLVWLSQFLLCFLILMRKSQSGEIVDSQLVAKWQICKFFGSVGMCAFWSCFRSHRFGSANLRICQHENWLFHFMEFLLSAWRGWMFSAGVWFHSVVLLAFAFLRKPHQNEGEFFPAKLPNIRFPTQS